VNFKKNIETALASLAQALMHGANPQRVFRAAKAIKFSGIVVRSQGYGEAGFSERKTRGQRDRSLRSRSNRRKAAR
jgi:hypothetical protein